MATGNTTHASNDEGSMEARWLVVGQIDKGKHIRTQDKHTTIMLIIVLLILIVGLVVFIVLVNKIECGQCSS